MEPDSEAHPHDDEHSSDEGEVFIGDGGDHRVLDDLEGAHRGAHHYAPRRCF